MNDDNEELIDGIQNKITCEVVLRTFPDNNNDYRYCSFVLDADDQDLSEKIKDHIKIFKSILTGKSY
jgi:hypothetical protein